MITKNYDPKTGKLVSIVLPIPRPGRVMTVHELEVAASNILPGGRGTQFNKTTGQWERKHPSPHMKPIPYVEGCSTCGHPEGLHHQAGKECWGVTTAIVGQYVACQCLKFVAPPKTP